MKSAAMHIVTPDCVQYTLGEHYNLAVLEFSDQIEEGSAA
jgi:hypothetical protein